MTTEISITLKGPGREDPWITVRGDDVQEVHDMLAEIHEKDIFTATGRAQTALKRGLHAGAHLDATTTGVEKVDDKAKADTKKPEAKQEEPKQEAKPEAAKKKPPKPAWA